MKQRCFTECLPEATVHFQLIDMGRQLYIWAGVGRPSLSAMCMAIKTPMTSPPAVATLMDAGASNNGHCVAARLTMKAHKPVLCSWNIPSNNPILEAFAEKRLKAELAVMAKEAEDSGVAAS
ncbi:hypothetical protein V8C86DRAFT_2828868 [Haematococcus lacustris]